MVTPEDFQPKWVTLYETGWAHVLTRQKLYNVKYQEQYSTQTWGTGSHLFEVLVVVHICACVYTAGLGIFVPLAQFCCELKTILKNKEIENKSEK